MLGDAENGGRRTDEAECHIYKRVEREFCSRTAQRDDKRKVLVFGEPLLARQTLMNTGSVKGRMMAIRLY